MAASTTRSSSLRDVGIAIFELSHCVGEPEPEVASYDGAHTQNCSKVMQVHVRPDMAQTRLIR